MGDKVHVAGVGMIPFAKPGASDDWDVMAEAAIRMALDDSGVDYRHVQQAYAGYVYADSTAGQSALYRVGITGIPVVNVNNNCATGSTALYLARQIVELGGADCVLAFGFEQMVPGALGMVFGDRKPAMEMHQEAQRRAVAENQDQVPFAARFFANAGSEYQKRYGAKDETFAKVTVKARAHAEHNPRAIFRSALTVEDVMASKRLAGPLTRYQACPPTCGAAAAVLVSPAFARKHGLDTKVAILGQSMTTDVPASFDKGSMISLVGYDMSKEAARQVYEQSGVGPHELDVVELHDCFTSNELISYEALGLCHEGDAERFISDGDNTYGGMVVTNPSGGLLSKGHPIGATGLAQCFELTQQLRGQSGQRQVERARLGLQHNIGLGGACVVTLYGQA